MTRPSSTGSISTPRKGRKKSSARKNSKLGVEKNGSGRRKVRTSKRGDLQSMRSLLKGANLSLLRSLEALLPLSCGFRSGTKEELLSIWSHVNQVQANLQRLSALLLCGDDAKGSVLP